MSCLLVAGSILPFTHFSSAASQEILPQMEDWKPLCQHVGRQKSQAAPSLPTERLTPRLTRQDLLGSRLTSESMQQPKDAVTISAIRSSFHAQAPFIFSRQLHERKTVRDWTGLSKLHWEFGLCIASFPRIPWLYFEHQGMKCSALVILPRSKEVETGESPTCITPPAYSGSSDHPDTIHYRDKSTTKPGTATHFGCSHQRRYKVNEKPI